MCDFCDKLALSKKKKVDDLKNKYQFYEGEEVVDGRWGKLYAFWDDEFKPVMYAYGNEPSGYLYINYCPICGIKLL